MVRMLVRRRLIALKRAEAAKRAAQKTKAASDDIEIIQAVDQRSIEDIIRRGQQSGSVNLSAKQLSAVPVYLFKCHLGIVPDSMRNQPDSSSAASSGSSWYGARDLTTLKLANNEITTIPPEISLFGAITVLDLHGNNIESLPDSICDLVELVNVDLSANRIRALPSAFASLPALAVLNLANNQLPDFDLLVGEISDRDLSTTQPLPRLHTLNLSHNPLGPSAATFEALSRLPLLRELRMRSSNLRPTSVALSGDRSRIFPSLQLLDVDENPLEFSGVQSLLGDRIASYEGEPNRIHVLAAKRVIKEKWEIEAERRTRVRGRISTAPPEDEPEARPDADFDLAALTRAADKLAVADARAPSPSPISRAASPSPSNTLAKWYDPVHGVLTLPECQPVRLRGGLSASTSKPPSVPPQTLPVEVFYQDFSSNLRSLVLSNRRLDKSFVLPDAALAAIVNGENASALLLPRLEQLVLEGCGLSNAITLTTEGGRVESRPIFLALGSMFPSVTTLDLSYNQLSTYEGLELILRRGLKILRLRGNQYQNTDLFADLAQQFRDGSGVQGWQLTELDVRENNIERLNPLLGLLPLTGFHVEGNVFRVPQRRVWERDGTQGLLKWLKERID